MSSKLIKLKNGIPSSRYQFLTKWSSNCMIELYEVGSSDRVEPVQSKPSSTFRLALPRAQRVGLDL